MVTTAFLILLTRMTAAATAASECFPSSACACCGWRISIVNRGAIFHFFARLWLSAGCCYCCGCRHELPSIQLADVDGCRCRRLPLSSIAVVVSCHCCPHCRQLPLSSVAIVVSCHCRRLPLPSPVAIVVGCNCRPLPLSSVAIVVGCNCRRLPLSLMTQLPVP